jgi:hypothetical protein
MLGQELSASDRAVNLRLEALEQLVGELRADIAVERAARNQNVVDLPDFLRRKNAAT